MPQVPDELIALRDIWQQLSSKSKANQQAIARRSATIGHLVPGMVEAQRNKDDWPRLSTAYVSQMLNESEQRAPSGPMVSTLALSMEATYQSVREQIPDTDQGQLDEAFAKVLADLRIRPTTWGDPGFPFEPFAENLIVDDAFESRFALAARTPRFGVAINGGYRVGKSTQLGRALQHLERNGYYRHDISTGSLGSETVGAASVLSSLAAELNAPDAQVATVQDLDAVMEAWLATCPLRTVLVIEDANAMALAADSAPLMRNMFRHWTQRVRRSSESSPWRRLSILLAYSYNPQVARGPALYSETPTLQEISPSPFAQDDVVELTKLWIEHQGVDTTRQPSDQHLEVWAEDLVDYVGGHPYLIHDAVRTWAENPQVALPAPGEIETAGRRQFVKEIRAMVDTTTSSRPGSTTVMDARGVATVVRAQELVLANLGLVESGEWACDFVAEHVAPGLPQEQPT